jgi:hypothetical protein
MSVQEFTHGVQVAGVDGGFDQDVHHDGAQIRESQPGVRPPLFRPLRWVAESPGGDDLVGVGDGGAVCSQDVRHRLVGTDLPIPVVTFGPEVQRLAGHHHLEPVPLVRQGEVPHQTEARPPGGQHGLAKLLVGQSLELCEHVLALTVEAVEQQITIRTCIDGHTNTLKPYETYELDHVAPRSSGQPDGNMIASGRDGPAIDRATCRERKAQM